jgi:hypothetical protein
MEQTEMTQTKKTDPIDITAFDSMKDSEAGYDLELKQPDGMTGTGVVVTVIGRHSDVVMTFNRKRLNKALRDQQIAEKRGKPIELSAEKLRDEAIEDAALRVTGWKNVKQPYTPQLLKAALVRNPHWIDQILEASNDLGNFTTSS